MVPCAGGREEEGGRGWRVVAGPQLGNIRTSVVEVEGMTGFLFTVGLFFGGFKNGCFLRSSRTASRVPSCATCGEEQKM